MKNESKENFFAFNVCVFFLFLSGLAFLIYNFIIGGSLTGYTIGGIILLFSALLTLFYVYIIRKHHGSLSEFWDNLRFHAENATKDSLINAPMPVVIFTANGRVLWNNERFDNLFDQGVVFDTPFEEIFADQSKELLLKKVSSFSCYIKNKHFEVKGNYVYQDRKDESPTFIVFYLYENTEIYNNSVKYLEEQPVMCVITIDNYDDVLLSTPDSQRSLLLAEIDTKISKWVTHTNGVLKKIDKDRYHLFFTRNHLPPMLLEKFSILDEIRAIQCGNKFAPTLSIGIGAGSMNYKELDDLANSSIALALGRGGDQAVVKLDNDVKFFGGKNREHEKTTKIKARVTANALKDLLVQAENIVIMGHKIPDMDAIGAAIGICAMARTYDKPVQILYENNSPAVNGLVNRVKQSNADYEKIFVAPDQAAETIGPKTLLVIVDTHKPSYTYHPLFVQKIKNIVLIDHHRRGEDFIDHADLVYHEPYASSTCEMVAEMLQYAGTALQLEAAEAEAIYAGIMLDTKDFAMKTGVRTFEAAAYLKRCGVDIQAVRKFFRNDFESSVQLARIMSEAITVNGNIAVSGIQNPTADTNAIAPQAADRLLSISGIEASFVLCARPEEISISGRSTGNINVQLIMEKLGGGGHLTMAGAQLKDCTYEEAQQRLIQAINQYLDELI